MSNMTIFDILKRGVILYANEQLGILVTYNGLDTFTIWVGDLDDSGWVEGESWEEFNHQAQSPGTVAKYIERYVNQLFQEFEKEAANEDSAQTA